VILSLPGLLRVVARMTSVFWIVGPTGALTCLCPLLAAPIQNVEHETVCSIQLEVENGNEGGVTQVEIAREGDQSRFRVTRQSAGMEAYEVGKWRADVWPIVEAAVAIRENRTVVCVIANSSGADRLTCWENSSASNETRTWTVAEQRGLSGVHMSWTELDGWAVWFQETRVHLQASVDVVKVSLGATPKESYRLVSYESPAGVEKCSPREGLAIRAMREGQLVLAFEQCVDRVSWARRTIACLRFVVEDRAVTRICDVAPRGPYLAPEIELSDASVSARWTDLDGDVQDVSWTAEELPAGALETDDSVAQQRWLAP